MPPQMPSREECAALRAPRRTEAVIVSVVTISPPTPWRPFRCELLLSSSAAKAVRARETAAKSRSR